MVQLKVNRRPQDFGLPQSRWTLSSLLGQLQPVLRVKTPSGLWQVLQRLGFSYQRARAYVRSPDERYGEKLAYIHHVIGQHVAGKVEVLFADQFTYHNHPGVNRAFAERNGQPRSAMAIGGEKQRRVAACMNCFTGQVTFIQRQKTTVPSLVQLYRDVCRVYSGAETIYVIMDNWPVHFHPDIIEALVPQTTPFELRLPQSWKKLKPSGKYAQLNLPIQIVTLPTYASWLNPIEKLWKLLKKDIIHQHAFAHHFKELFGIVEAYLEKFKNPSSSLLSFAGLLKTDGIFAQSISKANPNFFKLGG